MVVTPLRLHAVRYHQTIREYIAESGGVDLDAAVILTHLRSGLVAEHENLALIDDARAREALRAHRRAQQEERSDFGPDYRDQVQEYLLALASEIVHSSLARVRFRVRSLR